MSGKVQYRGTIGSGIIGQLLHMPVGSKVMDLSLKRDSPVKVTQMQEMIKGTPMQEMIKGTPVQEMRNPENASTPLTVVVGNEPEPRSRKQKHPQSVRATLNASPSLIYPVEKLTIDKTDQEIVSKKRKLETDNMYNGDLIYEDPNHNITKDNGESVRQQFQAFKRLSSQRWETLHKENCALKQDLNLLKNVLITYLKSQNTDRDAQDAVEALQNAYYVVDDTPVSRQEKPVGLSSNESSEKPAPTSISNGTIKEQLKMALAEKQNRPDPETEKYKNQCDSLQKQIKVLQSQCEKLRARMLPALSHETRSFLRWVLMTADEGDDLIDVSSMTYYQPIPQVVENETSWRHINGANDSWRATPTDSWKDGPHERAANSVPPVDEQHLTPVSAQGVGALEDTELWPGTGVYVNSVDLAGYVENSHKNPAVLFHSLVKHFFTLDQLSRSVPYGPHNNKKCDKEILPENIVKAIEGYVLCCASQPGWKSWTQHQLRKAFSNKCTGARRNHIRPDGEFGDDSDLSMMEWSTGSPSLVKKETTPPIVVAPLEGL